MPAKAMLGKMINSTKLMGTPTLAIFKPIKLTAMPSVRNLSRPTEVNK
jgi:hypothetical protein